MGKTPESLKDRRQRLHLTQQQLADLAAVKLSMVADIESGRQRPNAVTARQLEKALKEAEVEYKDRTVGEIFVLARIEAGLTQEELAKTAKIDAKRFAKWEAGIGGSLSNEEVFRVSDVIDAAGEKKSLAEGRGVPLSALAGRISIIERVADRESAKEAERVVGVVNERLLREEIELAETMAAKVPGLEAEISALKGKVARIELLNKEIGESKDREIQALREQLKRKKTLVTIPPEEILGTEE